MRESITGYTIFNNNRMVKQQQDDRLVLVMESDADISVVDTHTVHERLRVAPGYSKTAVVEASRLHRDAGDDWVVCFVDRDFQSEAELEQGNLFCSAFYDLDAEIYFACPELMERFYATHCDSGNQAGLAEVKQQIQEMTEAVGILRFAIIGQEVLEVSVSGFPMGELAKAQHGDTYLARVITVSAGRAQLSQSQIETLRATVEATKSDIDPEALCNGHDLIGAMAATLASVGHLRPRPAELAAAFRAAVGCDCFRRLSVFSKLSAWATRKGLESFWECDLVAEAG